MRFNTLLALGLLVSTSALAAPAKFGKSSGSVEWKGVKTTGDSHTGTIDVKDGSLDLAAKKGEFVIDMKTIKVTDSTPEDKKSDLVGHLSNKDFFDVGQYPEAKLLVKDIVKDAGSTDKYKVTGELTISGKTNPVSFPATIVEKDKKTSIETVVTFDRTKFGQSYKAKTGLIDKAKAIGANALIENDVALTIKLQSI